MSNDVKISPPDVTRYFQSYEDLLNKLTELEDYGKMLHEHIEYLIFVGVHGKGGTKLDGVSYYDYSKYLDIVNAWTEYFRLQEEEEEKRNDNATCPFCERELLQRESYERELLAPEQDNTSRISTPNRLVKPKRSSNRRRSNRGAKKQRTSVRSKKQNSPVRRVQTKRKGRSR